MIYERSQARRVALQGLYQLDVQGDEFLLTNALGDFINETTDDPRVREMAYFMARSAWQFHATADSWFARLAEKWPVYRMATVDRNILRLATWEIVNYPQTPPKVALDEAINLAKEFSTADSPAFINGVLDAVLKEHLALTGPTRTASPADKNEPVATPPDDAPLPPETPTSLSPLPIKPHEIHPSPADPGRS